MTLSPEVLSGLRDRLEPCPFCGGAVELTSSKTLGDRLFCIKCPDDSPCVGSGLGIYVVAGQVETAIAAWNRRAALDLSPPVVEEGEPLKRYDIEPWQDENGFMFIERSENPAGAWMLAEDVLSASPVPEPQAVAWKNARDEIVTRLLDMSLVGKVLQDRTDVESDMFADELRALVTDVFVNNGFAAPLSGGGKVEVTNGVVDAQWQWLCDKDDRSSPVEYPDMALVTRDELGEIIVAVLSTMGGKRP